MLLQHWTRRYFFPNCPWEFFGGVVNLRTSGPNLSADSHVLDAHSQMRVRASEDLDHDVMAYVGLVSNPRCAMMGFVQPEANVGEPKSADVA